MGSYHKYRKWEGHPFGTASGFDYGTGRRKVIEPFVGACGSCGLAASEHISEMTTPQKLQMMDDMVEQSKEQTARLEELIHWFRVEGKVGW